MLVIRMGKLLFQLTNQNPNGNGNVVAARAEGKCDWNNEVKANAFMMANFAQAFNIGYSDLQYLSLYDTDGSAKLFEKFLNKWTLTKVTSTNTKFANQSTERKPSLHPVRKNLVVRQPNAFQSEHTTSSKNRVPPKVDETNNLSKPVTSNSIPTPQDSKIVKHDNVIAPGMFMINPFKPSREEKYVPNKVRASVRTNPITVSQPHVITKKEVNSDSNGLSSTGVDNTANTRRPQPRSNTLISLNF
ncbi:hypothetical protein Tco_1153076 [Tanacetum coccineum]